MKKLILTCLVFSLGLATVINIPVDYETIQEGIDAAVANDLVLVQPGTYYENLNIPNKNITVGSLFVTTGDDSYIENTIIDGNASGSVVIFSGGSVSRATPGAAHARNEEGVRPKSASPAPPVQHVSHSRLFMVTPPETHDRDSLAPGPMARPLCPREHRRPARRPQRVHVPATVRPCPERTGVDVPPAPAARIAKPRKSN